MRSLLIAMCALAFVPSTVFARDCSPRPPSCEVQANEVERTTRVLNTRTRAVAIAQVALNRAQTRATALQLRFTEHSAVLQQRIAMIDQRNTNRLSIFTSKPSNDVCRVGCVRFDILISVLNRQAENVRTQYNKYFATKVVIDLQGNLIVQRARTRFDNAVAAQNLAQENSVAAATGLQECRALPPIPQC